MTKTLPRRRYKNPAMPQMPQLGSKQPAGQQSGPKQPEHRIGETKSVNGVTYRLNATHRWELASHDDPEQAHGAQPIAPGDVDKAQQAVEVDHKRRAAFVSKQLGQVDPQVGNLMRAMQAAPEFQKGAEYATKAIHPKQAAGMYAYLQQNANTTAGGGEVRDLGNGNLGFSSPAGAIVISAPGADGRHQVHYTAKTGVVDRAMQAGQAGGQQVKADQLGANGSPPAQVGLPQSGPPSLPVQPQDTNQRQATQDGPWLAHEQDDASQLRIGAESARADYENAIADWEKAAKNAESGGKAGWFKENDKWVKKSIPTVADRKVLAQHRSKVASLRTIWKDKQSAVDQHGKKQAAAAKQAAKGKAADAGGASPEERELMEKTGLNLDQARRMMQPAKPLVLNKPKSSKKVQQALQSAAAALGIAMGGQGANPPEAKAESVSKADAAVDEWKTPEGGGGPIPETKRDWVPDKQRWKQDLHKHLESTGLQNHPDNLAALQKAVDDGHINDHDQLKRVLDRAKKLHERGVGQSGKVADRDTSALKESLRRRRERSEKGPRRNFDEHVKQAANDHGMDEGSMRNIVDQVWGEKKKFYDARESAKAHARKMLGANRGTMNALERANKDDTLDEDGEVARELAREYPELGMPNPDHEDGSRFNYSEAMQELIKEGPQPPPSNTSPEFWDEIAQFVHSQESGSAESSIMPEERERLDSVPFAKWGKDALRLRYESESAKFCGQLVKCGYSRQKYGKVRSVESRGNYSVAVVEHLDGKTTNCFLSSLTPVFPLVDDADLPAEDASVIGKYLASEFVKGGTEALQRYSISPKIYIATRSAVDEIAKANLLPDGATSASSA